MTRKQALERDRREIFRGILQHRSFDASKVLLHGCNQQTVRDSILALRRGPIRFRRGAMIVCEGDPTDYIYMVVSGAIRSCRTYRDGSRGVVAFYLPGELFGWSGEPIHSLSLEAATSTLVLFLKRGALLAAAMQNSRIASYLLAATTNELRRTQEYSLLMSRSAKCRVTTFLIDLSMRLEKTEYLGLPMSHHDIADHLGLSIETLSRTITALEQSGSIARAPHRTLVLRNRASMVRHSPYSSFGGKNDATDCPL
jgi:CRP/FNR family nitrogen fixation transcriptional regulator